MNEVETFRILLESQRREYGDGLPAKIDTEMEQANFTFLKGVPAGWQGGLRSYLINSQEQYRNKWMPMRQMRRQETQTWFPFVQLAISDNNLAPDGIVSLRVALIALEADKLDGKPRGFGLRFDAPLIGGQTGEHDYFHIQLSSLMRSQDGGDNLVVPGAELLLPPKEPAVPTIKPERGIEFLLLMLVSLYGWKGLQESLSDSGQSLLPIFTGFFSQYVVRSSEPKPQASKRKSARKPKKIK